MSNLVTALRTLFTFDKSAFHGRSLLHLDLDVNAGREFEVHEGVDGFVGGFNDVN